MKNWFKFGVVGFAAVVSTAAFASSNVVGIWHGIIRIDPSKLPNEPDATQRKARLAAMKDIQQVKLTLSLMGDHSFTMVSVGGHKQTPNVRGKWSAVGNAITVQEIKAGVTGQASTFTLSKDAKNMRFDQGAVTLMFFR